MENTTTITITITYELTQEAQRVEALAGRDAHQLRTIDACIPTAEALTWPGTYIDASGMIYTSDEAIYLNRHWGKYVAPARQDHLLTADEALTAVRARCAAWTAALANESVLAAARAAAEAAEGHSNQEREMENTTTITITITYELTQEAQRAEALRAELVERRSGARARPGEVVVVRRVVRDY